MKHVVHVKLLQSKKQPKGTVSHRNTGLQSGSVPYVHHCVTGLMFQLFCSVLYKITFTVILSNI